MPPPGHLIRPRGDAHTETLAVGGRTYQHLRDGLFLAADANSEEVAGLFDAIAPGYEADYITEPFNRAVTAALLETISGGQRFQTVLDFGCGTGIAAPWVQTHSPGCIHLGVEPAAAMAARASSRGITVVDVVGGRIQYPSASVDGVFGAFVLALLREPGALNDLGRILRPGARAAFNLYRPSVEQAERCMEWLRGSGLRVTRRTYALAPLPALDSATPPHLPTSLDLIIAERCA